MGLKFRDLRESNKDSNFMLKLTGKFVSKYKSGFFLPAIPEKLRELPKYYGGGGGNYGLLIT